MEMLKWIKMVDPSRVPPDFKINEAEDPKAFLKRVSAAQADQTGEHQAERCFHLEASEQSYVLDWHGCITHYDWHTEETGGVYVFSGQWKFKGLSDHYWSNHCESWLGIRAKLMARQVQRGYVWDLDHGTVRRWGGDKGAVHVDLQWLRRNQGRAMVEAEDPKHFLRTLGTGEAIRTKGDLRRYIAAQIRRMPEKDSDDGAGYPNNLDFLGAWYKRLDTEVMPRIIKALERFYGKQAPNGTSGLFRTWIKNKQTERRAAQIIAAFEEIIEDE
jgi:hypothetical protein